VSATTTAPDVRDQARALDVAIPCNADRATTTRLIEAAIIRLVTSEPDAFDRPRFDRLMAIWSILQTPLTA
jgi:hypothetical protein